MTKLHSLLDGDIPHKGNSFLHLTQQKENF